MSPRRVFFRIAKYLHYWLIAESGYALQSPFLFGLYSCVLNKYRGKHSHTEAEQKREQYKQDKSKVPQINLGAATTLPTNISSIARWGISSARDSKFLVSLIEYRGAKRILELGTSLGINTIYMSSAPGVEEVLSIEGNPKFCDMVQGSLEELGMENVKIVNGDVTRQLKSLVNAKCVFDFIYLDANHTYDGTIENFSLCQALLSDTGVIVLDDINWSKGMHQAWVEIKTHNPELLIIENYKFGLVFGSSIEPSGSYVISF